MKAIRSEKNLPGIRTRVFARSGGAGDWKERVETDLSLFFAFAAAVVLSLAMFVALYRWTLNAPVLPPDDGSGPPITETML